eukprot:CAMPEP_0184661098 /NCGR_PEP_ID=MMETSP0308-20130426/36989_1 /TAXON_ID=38269 /ORGANISM="Gloeochaete witrockiana, Strain SAG 46.84" /LENGTH=450 /DNA_ID=CAMNT_0027102183 /DNA_START=171 /DNA_END=1523 /DNA_ORIENTATION=+
MVPRSPSLVGNRIERLAKKYSGRGVTVGIIGFSFNLTGGANEDMINGNLPGPLNPYGHNQPVIVLSEGKHTKNDEGRAMLQVVHRIAPKAKLCFASPGSGRMSDTIRQLANRTGPCRANIIADDALGSYESPFEDTDIDQAIDEFSRRGGLYFSVANNYASWAYQYPVQLVSRTDPRIPPALRAITNASKWVQYPSGLFLRPYTIGPGSKFVTFFWNEPYNLTWTDLDIYLFTNTLTLVAYSAWDNSVGGAAAERIDFKVNVAGTYFVAVGLKRQLSKRVRVAPPLTAWLLVSSAATETNSIRGHAGGKSVITVGAYHWNSTKKPSSSSGRGPVTRFWDSEKRLLSQRGEVRYKPDFGAAHCTPTSFFITNPWINYTVHGIDFPQFCGTSGAVCNIAGVAALLKHMYRPLNRSSLVSLVKRTGTGQWDPQAGYGLINGDAIMDLIKRGKV